MIARIVKEGGSITGDGLPFHPPFAKCRHARMRRMSLLLHFLPLLSILCVETASAAAPKSSLERGEQRQLSRSDNPGPRRRKRLARPNCQEENESPVLQAWLKGRASLRLTLLLMRTFKKPSHNRRNQSSLSVASRCGYRSW